MVYEGINFNEDWVKTKTQDEFLAEVEINQHWWPNDPKRIDKAKSFYSLIMPKAKAGPKKPAKASSIAVNDDLLDGLKDRIDKKQADDVHGAKSDDPEV